MTSVNSSAILVDTMRVMERQLRGAITTGITPEPDARSMPATSSDTVNADQPRGSFLSRALRFPAKIGARQKVANGSFS
jgi:hypothetical protein